MFAPAARHAERGQTLPVWTASILTALTLMFFAMNYANVVRWQVRAQNAADAAAAAALTVQANQWNKMTAILYGADIEEWRIRRIMQALVYLGQGNGGCNPNNGTFYFTDNCASMYWKIQPQLYRAMNRYTSDIKLLQSVAPYGLGSQKTDAYNVVRKMASSCTSGSPMTDCAFTYHVIDYSARPTTEQVGKDAYNMKMGGFSTSQNSTPVADLEPARIEIATCATVQPVFNFSLFGARPGPTTVVGRAAATTEPVTAEWFEPGVLTNPGTSAFFQPAEVYDFESVSNYPMYMYWTPFGPVSDSNAGYTTVATPNDDFSILAAWWASVPIATYSGPQTEDTLCTAT